MEYPRASWKVANYCTVLCMRKSAINKKQFYLVQYVFCSTFLFLVFSISIILAYFYVLYSKLLHLLPPHRFQCLEEAGIEPGTIR